MALLYYFETTIDFCGKDQNSFFKKWLEIAQKFIAYPSKATGVEIKQFWKICGENKLIGVLSVETPGQLDICFATLLKQQTEDIRITTEVKPFRPYEDFAGTVAERCNRSLDATHVDSVTKEGLYYFLWSRVEYMGITQLDLCNTWTDEAIAAIKAKKLGNIVDLWKVVAERQEELPDNKTTQRVLLFVFELNHRMNSTEKVWVIVRMNSLKDADELLTFDLPILKKMGAQVYTKCKSIRPVSQWIEDLKKLVS